MKFGKYIQELASEWAEQHYINYKGLKKIISSVKQTMEHIQVVASNPVGSNEEFQSLRIAFFYQLERELEKVFAYNVR